MELTNRVKNCGGSESEMLGSGHCCWRGRRERIGFIEKNAEWGGICILEIYYNILCPSTPPISRSRP